MPEREDIFKTQKIPKFALQDVDKKKSVWKILLKNFHCNDQTSKVVLKKKQKKTRDSALILGGEGWKVLNFFEVELFG